MKVVLTILPMSIFGCRFVVLVASPPLHPAITRLLPGVCLSLNPSVRVVVSFHPLAANLEFATIREEEIRTLYSARVTRRITAAFTYRESPWVLSFPRYRKLEEADRSVSSVHRSTSRRKLKSGNFCWLYERVRATAL